MHQTFYLLLHFTFTTIIPYKLLYFICSFPCRSSHMEKECITVPTLKPFHPRYLVGHDFLSFEQLANLVFDLSFFLTIAPCGTTGSKPCQSFLEFLDLPYRRPKRFITPCCEALRHTLQLSYHIIIISCSTPGRFIFEVIFESFPFCHYFYKDRSTTK
jgi:hypothetical protein